MTIAGVVAAALLAGLVVYNRVTDPGGQLPAHLPGTPHSYLGIYLHDFPREFSGLTAFASATGSKPDVAMYYSGWYVPFPARFAAQAAQNGVAPFVQMDPDQVSMASIAAGQSDPYLSSYAEAVHSYGGPVIIGFAHEMNGSWYPWGYGRTKPAVFIAAWRHVVGLFRALGATNVTWLWTVNIVNNTRTGRIPSPKAWWPGSRWVTWVGIDGYYLKHTWQFAPLFGPTIGLVRQLTSDPVLIGETGVVAAADQPAKIADLFKGIQQYGLLGFVWFDGINSKGLNFTISSPAAFDAVRKGASSFSKPGS